MDRLMEQCLREISRVVGNEVTSKVMNAMERMFRQHAPQSADIIQTVRDVRITQDSPEKNTVFQQYRETEKTSIDETTKRQLDTTQQMISALENIEQNQLNTSDPTHDNTTQGSVMDQS